MNFIVNCKKPSLYAVVRVLFLVFITRLTVDARDVMHQNYLKYKDLKIHLRELEDNYSNLLKLHSVAKSPEGRDIWALQITNDQWPSGKKTTVKLEGSANGDDSVGREILLRLASHLLENFGKEENISKIINESSIYIIPNYDPDGFENSIESCSELFPKSITGEPRHPFPGVMFDMSLTFLGGDIRISGLNCSKSKTDTSFQAELFQNYQRLNEQLKSGVTCADNQLNSDLRNPTCSVSDGINMAVYLFCCKYPLVSELEQVWTDNRDAILSSLLQTHKGLRGFVVDSVTRQPIRGASVLIDGRNVTTDDRGSFVRLLLDGLYRVAIHMEGYESQEIKVLVMKHKFSSVRLFLVPNFNRIAEEVNEILKVAEDMKVKDNIFDNTSNLYHMTHRAMEDYLNRTVSKCSDIMRMYRVGSSVKGHDLWVVEVSDHPGIHELGEPEFKYIGNMHGNEVVGRVLLLNLLEVICSNYNISRFVSLLVNSTRLHVMPTMNPDGYDISNLGDQDSVIGRMNANNYDLNRNFPDQYEINDFNFHQELETLIVMDWCRSLPFVLSANLHGGAIVANYPFDDLPQSMEGYSRSPDDDTFRMLASSYSKAHATMHNGNLCEDKFEGGIVNGAVWYPVAGGMQDWNYLNTNCFEITLELGCTKYPLINDLLGYWNDNKESLFVYMAQVHKGVKGFVTECLSGQPIEGATIFVEGIGHDINTTKAGEYWRLLTPGSYKVTAAKSNYASQLKEVIVSSTDPAEVNFCLHYFGPDSLSRDWSNEFDFGVEENLRMKYSSMDEISNSFVDIVGTLPEYFNVSRLGKEGRVLRVLDVSHPNSSIEVVNILLIGRLRRNDPIGTEMLINLVNHLAAGLEAKNEDIVKLLKNVHLHILPVFGMSNFKLPEDEDCEIKFHVGQLQSEELSILRQHIARENHKMDIIVSLEGGYQGVRYPKSLRNPGLHDYLSDSFLATSVRCHRDDSIMQQDQILDIIDLDINNSLIMSIGLHCCSSPSGVDLVNTWIETQGPLFDLFRAASKGARIKVQTNHTEEVKSHVKVQNFEADLFVPGDMFVPLKNGKCLMTVGNSTKEIEIDDDIKSVKFQIMTTSTVVNNLDYDDIVMELTNLSHSCQGFIRIREVKPKTTVVTMGRNSENDFRFGIVGGFHGDEVGHRLMLQFVRDLCAGRRKLEEFFTQSTVELMFIDDRIHEKIMKRNYKNVSSIVEWVGSSHLDMMISVQQGNSILLYPDMTINTSRYFANVFVSKLSRTGPRITGCRSREYVLVNANELNRIRNKDEDTFIQLSKTSHIVMFSAYLDLCGSTMTETLEHQDQMNSFVDALEEFFNELPTGITGRIADHQDKPISHAHVTIEAPPIQILVNQNGLFHFLLPIGQYSMNFSAENFNDIHQDFSISNETRISYLKLKPTKPFNKQLLIIVLTSCTFLITILSFFTFWRLQRGRAKNKWQPIRQEEEFDSESRNSSSNIPSRIAFYKNSGELKTES